MLLVRRQSNEWAARFDWLPFVNHLTDLVICSSRPALENRHSMGANAPLYVSGEIQLSCVVQEAVARSTADGGQHPADFCA
jgi:hypothetical protein